ncbi:MAG: hypothetical protein GYA36_18990 [Veillonellaceae bacterium]|nr:hypothetical protein [Veillonellaceae bacterium]
MSQGWLELVRDGNKGRVVVYVRPNGRSPGKEFLESAYRHLKKRFERAFDLFSRQGMSTASQRLFKPLNGEGKGLWTFKEHDHRLFCFRGPDWFGKSQIVLLGGWVKDKDSTVSGGVEERREIGKAQVLKQECLKEVDWKAPPRALGAVQAPVEPEPMSVAVQTPSEPQAVTQPLVVVEEVAPAPPEPPKLKEEPMSTTTSTRPMPDKEPLTCTVLAELSGSTVSSVVRMAAHGRLPGFDRVGGHKTYVWPWSMADELVAKIQAFRATTKNYNRRPGIHMAQAANGLFPCPKCGKEFATRTSASSHYIACKKVPTPTSAAVDQEKVLTKSELAKMAKEVIKGVKTPDDFAAAVKAHNARVANLKEELRRLKK